MQFEYRGFLSNNFMKDSLHYDSNVDSGGTQMSNIVAFKQAEITPPTNEKSTVLNRRDYITMKELKKLIELTKNLRNGDQTALMLTMAFRHGLRVSELVNMTWAQIFFDESQLHVIRCKKSRDSMQPIQGDELRMLRKQRRDNPNQRYVFLSERGAPYTSDGFRKRIARLIAKAKEKDPTSFDFNMTPHSLRHGCGHYLANSKRWETRRIQEYLGHVNIQHTVRYTELSGHKFNDLVFS
ncbi:integrase [Thalassotalea sp. HSM 43]|uniref:tyrosine-type recombinase/integrase n=1 Tax=Thalassotalea sp. HSM 43 TaxID=2552945 RepID=UPI0010820E4F|nr:tyrosine-type recombinase/integrase [Thalassotalea sp. HSM 43]QBY02937.1 integrase [Thalassotalea sp. HSM 43]